MDKNKTHPTLKKILDYDVKLTKSFVSFLLNFVAFRSVKNHCRLLEISCHGIAWLASWMAFCWLINSPSLYNMQINMLMGLLVDIVIVAVIKAATRRRRPTADVETIGIGPDKFSFPSGHASRAFFIVGFFTVLYPLPVFMWPALIAWASSVAVSRLLMYRHHCLDVCAGIILGLFETLIMYVLWLGPELTKSIMLSISEDYVPGGPE
ncbi:polyisoprenoid diphosphate/phosphate phosphohydrolase PLPP6 [Eupeodes corollae]|uniref:polyisoprenoid diphosphate/phosphate phosphohydrolase PLPP6 n=1 Tax=Eupeodes corollae TaxID=290404 RepID=UPI002492B5A6|nr:polyisoprenoid diphosphate/phosphate phosphohydrolase PLPP6 [Eupeodes corollae]XP_055910592.1 polyisoprenoid diphosphate/phosphate phosphohydrolase PLPP6 [Eupeodes corollae]